MASIMEGPLSKWTNVMKGWQYRWFVLDYNAGLLSYYTGAVIGIDDEDDSTFTITVDQKTFHFQARDADEREKWIHALEGTILRHTLQLREAETGFVPSVQDFDKKLSEADAYLQILIDQLKVDPLSSSQLKLVSACPQIFFPDILEIKTSVSSRFLFKIQYKLVCLSFSPEDASQVCKSDQRPSSLPVGPVVTVMGSLQTPTPNSTGSGPSGPSSGVASPTLIPLPSHPVPDFSYSSSEDEFYDADEYYQSSTSPKHCADSSGPPAASPAANDETTLKRPNTTESLNSSMSNGTTDADPFDSHDDRDDDGEGESVEEHKSVIMHLLSQVRLGMDLTKVVLPTFILERRSLLEMYADFFAHPDLFVSIADQPEPRERMVQVVKWYLSAFHAGRKGSVAKKPYNPILGEVFFCHWDLPTETEDPSPHTEAASDGPVPWSSPNSVSFVAEQVSHHPPISAFYAECLSKKIQFNAHIWTKSKFLGMSIGVHNIGQGCVSCLEHDEHYILTFPNGYGRGGATAMVCLDTKASSIVFYDTTPYHTVPCHALPQTPIVFSRFCILSGMRKLEDQLEYESRRLWRDVTVNLKLKDIEAATEAKHRLEEKQRAEARERKEKEQQWETRLFHEDGECWIYDEPLLNRLASQRH
uniref:Oxysterol-binding protein n=1 Tax=Nothobranchius furzeri TaxID=105023 RepID=A0A8C6VYP7_NOTFU